jgi:hypothetical protein
MDFQIHVNLPYSHLGLLFLFYYLLAHTSLPRYIKRAALIYHRHTENRIYSIIHGKILHEDIYAIDDEVKKEEVKEEVEVEVKEEVKDEVEVQKEAEKFEDKYLTAFKSFSNEYFFTEEELREKAEKLEQLKKDYEASYKFDLDNLTLLLSQTTQIVSFPDGSQEVKNGLIKYFDIEDDFADDPSNYDFDELLNDLKNDHNRFTTQLQILNENTISETEFLDKALQHVLDKKLDGFINNYILEYTPLGNVYMRYNNCKKSFEYFSNNTIPYRYLEAIGRKYVMTFRCKALFIDLEEEMKRALEKDSLDTDKTLDKAPVVSKFKSYNKDTKPTRSSMTNNRPGQNNRDIISKANLPVLNTNNEKQLFKENANRYTWEGRLANLSVLKKVDRKIVDKNYTLSFADFKQMSQIKK